MSDSVERVTLDDMDLGSLVSEGEIEELFEGADNLIPDQDKESPVVEEHVPPTDAADAAPLEPDQVMLLNIRYPQQSFAMYSGGKYTGTQIAFQDGLLITDRDTANYIKSIAPHVYEEPREGYVFTHNATGFKTRNDRAYEEHVATYHRNL